jgi:CO/xanthine dehydrogenase Mo-binding subunit
VLRLGDTTASGQLLKEGLISAPLGKMIAEAAARTDFDGKWQRWPEENRTSGDIKKGIGIAVTYRGAGLGGEGLDTSSATLTVCHDGSITLHSGHTEMGQGMRTAHAQIAAETLGVDFDRIDPHHSDTSFNQDGGPTVASRGTQSGGRAVLDAANKLKAQLLDAAARKTGLPAQELDLRGDNVVDLGGQVLCSFDDLVKYCVYPLGTNLSAQGWYNPGLYHIDPETQQGACYQTYTFGVAIAEISVDMGTGKIKVDKVTLAYELGKAINPQLAYGQLVGGIIQGLGYALFEEMEEDRGRLLTTNFDDYLIPTTEDVPEIDLVLHESENPEGPYGAKGIGELGDELTAPAIGNALFHATGTRQRDLPFNLERVLLGKPLGKQVCP